MSILHVSVGSVRHRPFWLSLVSVKEDSTEPGWHQSPVTCQERSALRNNIHACGGPCVCVCIHSTSWTVVALYLLDQNSSHSSMNSMVSHHAEIQTVDSSTHLPFKNRPSLCISPPIVLTYLCMFSSCELSVTLTTFQTQRVVVSPQGPLFLTFAKEKWQLKQGRVGYSFGYLTKT